MRGIQITDFGSPLRLAELEIEKLPAGYARIKVQSNGICATDVKMVDGVGFRPKLPFTPGHEPAGIVEEINSDSESHRNLEGKAVVIHPHVACGMCENCISGNENICLRMLASYGINTNGGMQEYLNVPLRNLVALPDDVSMDMGALAGGVVAVPLRGLKQLGTLLSKKILILGTGGLAFSAVQIAKSMGAEVIVVGRKQEKLEVASRIGADFVINSNTTDYVAEIKKITGGFGVHHSVDLAGDSNEVPKLIQTVRRGGKVLIIGYSANTFQTAYNKLALDSISLMGTRSYTRNDLSESVGLISRNKCKPIISRIFPLEEANEAMSMVRTGQSVGRVTIHPNE
ncbi:MAG: alcohol dehydrogenase catalytic domain-containing protein [Candidatus Thermoplasmatota archaeon]|nr:alcohol dehydrogenase catalytic domain-containing protein [Candidatus Thermoplasmatota archaeon]